MCNFDLAIMCLPTLYFDYDNQSTLLVVLDGIDSQSPFGGMNKRPFKLITIIFFG